MSDIKQAYALIKASDLMDYFLNRADKMPNELPAQFMSDIAFGMTSLFDPEETIRVPIKGVIYQ